MAEILKDIALNATKKTRPEQRPKKPTIKTLNSEPRSSDPEERSSNNYKQDFLLLLKEELKTPFLGLLEEYVKRCSPNKEHKDSGKNMFIFKENHKIIYWLCFCCDFALLILFIYIVIAVALRGLQITLPFNYFFN